MDILEKLKGVIVEQLVVAETEIKLESKIVEDLGADSLDVVELVMAIEEEFDIEISDEVAENIASVQDMLTLLEKELG